MGQDPDQIRTDIEDTRARMGDTAEALGHKADVPGRAREAVADKVGTVKEKFTGAKESVSDASPSGADVKQGAHQAVGIAKENPLGLVLGAAAVGVVVGLLIPTTRVENEKLGPMADQVKEQAKETGQEALERGKHVAGQAVETAKEEGQKQAQQMAPTSS
ncbi:MAG: DUF3618 domain-containing protein [Thermoleophilaceae bacterium]